MPRIPSNQGTAKVYSCVGAPTLNQAAETEKRMSRYFDKNANMKITTKINFRLFFAFVLFFLIALNSTAQNSTETTDLKTFHEFDGNQNNRTSGWPWNGCKEFTITIIVGGIEVEFNVLNCCVMGICQDASVWAFFYDMTFDRSVVKDPKDIKEIKVIRSKEVRIGNYKVRVKEGVYQLDKEGRPKNLVYLGRPI